MSGAQSRALRVEAHKAGRADAFSLRHCNPMRYTNPRQQRIYQKSYLQAIDAVIRATRAQNPSV